jgi:hypothetical protein
VPERVVHVIVDVANRPRAADRAKEPLLLEARDVRVAPDERRDGGRHGRDELVVGDGLEEGGRRLAPALECPADLQACFHPPTVVDMQDGASRRTGETVAAII